MAEPSDDDLVLLMNKMVKTVDLQTTGVKKFTKLLSKELGGVELSHRKDFIKTTLADIINNMDDGSDDEMMMRNQRKRKKNSPRSDERLLEAAVADLLL